MNFVNYVIDLLRVLWFEVKQALRNVWGHIRVPLRVYVAVLAILVALTAAVGLGVLTVGTVMESNWTIFWGGIVLLGGIVLVGVVLIPVVLVINLVWAAVARITGGTR